MDRFKDKDLFVLQFASITHDTSDQMLNTAREVLDDTFSVAVKHSKYVSTVSLFNRPASDALNAAIDQVWDYRHLTDM
jgi:hypothetical protein